MVVLLMDKAMGDIPLPLTRAVSPGQSLPKAGSEGQ